MTENFHENKLWQEAYVVLMDIHKVLDEETHQDQDEAVVKDLVESAVAVGATIADSLTRQDKRVAHDLIFSAVGFVAKTRTHLAVAWGRGLMDDETFRSLDAKYDTLSSSLQNYK